MDRLRYGILVNNLVLQRWQLEVMERLEEENIADLTLIVRKEPKTKNSYKKIKNRKGSLLFRLYNKFYVKKKSHKLKPVDTKEFFAKVPVQVCEIEKKGNYSEYFSESDIAVIKEAKLDFIIRFGFGIIRGEILNAAKHGVWSYHHDDERVIRGGPPCFWEIFLGISTTGSILQRLTDRLDCGRVIRRGTFQTHPYSYWRNVDQAYGESARWVALEAKKITLNGKLDYARPASEEGSIYRLPTNSIFILFLVKCLFFWFRFIHEKLFLREIWNIAVIDKKVATVIENKKN